MFVVEKSNLGLFLLHQDINTSIIIFWNLTLYKVDFMRMESNLLSN